MPCAYKDRLGWIAEYRQVNHRRGTHQVRRRIPAARFAGVIDEAQARLIANAFAKACDLACRQLEMNHMPDDVRQALRLNVITQDQATGLLGGKALPPSEKERKTWTLREAADAHPSTKRMPPSQRWVYYTYLDDFQAFAGISTVAALTIGHVTSFIAHRKAEGDGYDTRKHRLLFIRRAARMGAALGVPDPLTGFTLDKREAGGLDFDTYDLAELAAFAIAFQAKRNWKALVALALGGLVGLRPQECIDVQIEDIVKDVLDTGTKTLASERKLPLPATVGRWIRELVGKRKSGPLFINARGNPFNPSTWGKWVRRELEDCAAVARQVKAKELRKSFSTWAIRAGLNERHVEAYLGHEDVLTNPTTRRHYLKDWLAAQLRPTALAIEAQLTAALASAADAPTNTPTAKRKSKASKQRAESTDL